MKFNLKIFGKVKGKLPQGDKKWNEKAEELQKKIGYKFKNIDYLKKAMTHLSFVRKSSSKLGSFERMEFFGDAILGFLVAECLFNKYPSKKEGYLSKLKSKVGSEKYLAHIAKGFNLGQTLFLSNEESKSGGRKRDSILSDVVESLICAIYIDGGIGEARKFVNDKCLQGFEKEVTRDYLQNYKSLVQEYFQGKFRTLPKYKIVSEEGPEHDKTFFVEVYFDGKFWGKGSGVNKKSAQQEAAKDVWQKIKKKEN